MDKDEYIYVSDCRKNRRQWFTFMHVREIVSYFEETLFKTIEIFKVSCQNSKNIVMLKNQSSIVTSS